jgi:DNA replication protein DnaC
MRSRTRARRHADAARRRAACCRRRQCPRPRPYLSGELRAGSVGVERDRCHRAALADPARQPFYRHAGTGAARARRAAIGPAMPDLRDIKGQESAKRALEIAAAGGHNLLMNGPPGAGKSMLAARLPSILPPLSPRELLECGSPARLSIASTCRSKCPLSAPSI